MKDEAKSLILDAISLIKDVYDVNSSPTKEVFQGLTALTTSTEPEPPKDDPALDRTQAAHPAWWRGWNAARANMGADLITILDGKDAGQNDRSEPWATVRRRVLTLMKSLFERTRTDLSQEIAYENERLLAELTMLLKRYKKIP